MEDSVFTKIIKGEIPSHKVYEDEKTLAFMDIYPVQPGMTVVIPKVQVEDFYDLPDDYYTALMATVKKVGTRLHEVFPDKKRITVQIEGLDVPHVHAKLYPVNDAKELFNEPDTSAEPDHAALAAMAERLKF